MTNTKTSKPAEVKEKKVKATKVPQTKFGVVNFPVGDFLIQIKNAAMAKNKTITVKTNKQITAIADALKKMGILDEVKKEEGTITLSLTFKNKRALITNIKLVSKPGLRIYMGVDEISDKKGPSTFLISSPKGVITSKEAKKLRVGGEVIAEIL